MYYTINAEGNVRDVDQRVGLKSDELVKVKDGGHLYLIEVTSDTSDKPALKLAPLLGKVYIRVDDLDEFYEDEAADIEEEETVISIYKAPGYYWVTREERCCYGVSRTNCELTAVDRNVEAYVTKNPSSILEALNLRGLGTMSHEYEWSAVVEELSDEDAELKALITEWSEDQADDDDEDDD